MGADVDEEVIVALEPRLSSPRPAPAPAPLEAEVPAPDEPAPKKSIFSCLFCCGKPRPTDDDLPAMACGICYNEQQLLLCKGRREAPLPFKEECGEADEAQGILP